MNLNVFSPLVTVDTSGTMSSSSTLSPHSVSYDSHNFASLNIIARVGFIRGTDFVLFQVDTEFLCIN
jgi:hypothetical protein